MIRASRVGLLLLLHFAVSTASKHREPHMHWQKESPNGEPIRHIDYTKLEHSLRTPSMGKLVAFTKKSCEKCLDFENTLLAIKHRMHPWRRILSIYVVYCEKIPGICKDYGILTPPALRFFPSNFTKGRSEVGDEIRIDREFEFIVYDVALALMHNKYKGATSPNFTPLQAWENDRTLFRDNPHIKYVVLVYQPKTSSVIGVLTLLDMLPYREVSVRIVDNRDLFENFDMKHLGQTLAVLEGSKITHRWTPHPEKAEVYVDLLRSHLRLVEKDKAHKPTPQYPVPYLKQ